MDDDPVETQRIWRHLPSRPSQADLERLAARMRDRLAAGPGYSPSTRRNWACGVWRRGGWIWVDTQWQPPSTQR